MFSRVQQYSYDIPGIYDICALCFRFVFVGSFDFVYMSDFGPGPGFKLKVSDLLLLLLSSAAGWDFARHLCFGCCIGPSCIECT